MVAILARKMPWAIVAGVHFEVQCPQNRDPNGNLVRFRTAPYNAAMIRLLAALLLTVALGVHSRLCPIGCPLYDKSLGDVLYAVAAYLSLALLLFRTHRLFIVLFALAWCLSVEAFQATGIPAEYAHLWIVRWLIGTDFSWHDVACYFVGVAAVVLVDVLLLRRRGRAVLKDR